MNSDNVIYVNWGVWSIKCGFSRGLYSMNFNYPRKITYIWKLNTPVHLLYSKQLKCLFCLFAYSHVELLRRERQCARGTKQNQHEFNLSIQIAYIIFVVTFCMIRIENFTYSNSITVEKHPKLNKCKLTNQICTMLIMIFQPFECIHGKCKLAERWRGEIEK